MGWLGNKFHQRTIDARLKEMSAFVHRLAAMDPDEIGTVVAAATHLRHDFDGLYQIDLMAPAVVNVTKPLLVVELINIVKDYQEQRNFTSAAGLMVWVHSLRALAELDLRLAGKYMWRELSRGFPHVPMGTSLNLEGFDQFPEGLDPFK